MIATATPAFATSGDDLTVAQGATRIATTVIGYPAILFDGFTIQSATALGANELTVNLTVSGPRPDTSLWYFPDGHSGTDDPRPWTSDALQNVLLKSLTFRYPSPVAANSPVLLSGALAEVVGTGNFGDELVTDFTVTVVVSAPNQTSVVRAFSSSAQP